MKVVFLVLISSELSFFIYLTGSINWHLLHYLPIFLYFDEKGCRGRDYDSYFVLSERNRIEGMGFALNELFEKLVNNSENELALKKLFIYE